MLDRAAIARASLDEASGLSVAAVARRLGVSQAALYHYVDGRSELVRLATDESLADWQDPPHELPWREFVHAYAVRLVDLLASRKGLDRLILELDVPPPRLIEVVRRVAERLVGDGVSEATARGAAFEATQIAHYEGLVAGRRAEAASDVRQRLRSRIDLVLDGVEYRRGTQVTHSSMDT